MTIKNYLLIFMSILAYSIHAQFYPIPSCVVKINSYYTYSDYAQVTPLQISSLITVQEFKEYLEDIKKDSSDLFYQNQLPKSRTISNDFVTELLSTKEYKNQPMPGISWTVAMNYCTWLNNKNSINTYKYDLPWFHEVLALEEIYPEHQSILSCWTLGNYDESYFEFGNKNDTVYTDSSNIFFNADDLKKQTKEHPSMTRKIIIGQSYHMNRKIRFNYEYRDSSSRYIGFRIVKRPDNRIIDSLKIDSTVVHYQFDNNHFNGVYQEKDSLGNTKVLGWLENGNRVGV